MEDLLARVHTAEEHVFDLLKRPDEPISALLDAFVAYRQVCLAAILADFRNVKFYESRLWQTHCAGKNYFHGALSSLRKRHTAQQQQLPVETRKLMQLYLGFIKKSQVFYRDYIFRLSTSSVGIPALEAVAQMRDKMKDKAADSGEGQSLLIAPEWREQVLKSAHQTLIYLGDLSRWRASEQLDKEPDFRPAIGYYALAATLVPASGMGHHQQAVVELEQRRHVYAIYHLYRALVVANPHPNAATNLHAEFKKINAAWDKGELFKKGPPNDAEAPKRALIGWFVRLHSICFKGDVFAGFEELEQEVVGRLTMEIKRQSSDEKFERLMRKMVLVNIAAQHWAGQRFQDDPDTLENQQSFFYFLRFNISVFTMLLRMFYDELNLRLVELEDNEAELAVKITPLIRCILPSMRLYNMWLLNEVHMVVGLGRERFLMEGIAKFWPCYARAIDLVAQGFPIWDLDDVEDVSYMLEEDADTIEFKPLVDEKTQKTWFVKGSSTLKKRPTDLSVVRCSVDDEMLQRIKDMLADGLSLATNDDDAPIFLRGTRVFFQDESNIDELVVRPTEHQPVAGSPVPDRVPPKPVSYAAAAAAHGKARPPHLRVAPKTVAVDDLQSRENQLKNMVADLVDDDDVNNPVTPPQQIASHPAVIGNGDLQFTSDDNEHDNGHAKLAPSIAAYSHGWVPRGNVSPTPPVVRPSPVVGSASHGRLQSVANLWDHGLGHVAPGTPSLANGATISPIAHTVQGHSRVDSTGSDRSRDSPNVADWSSMQNSLLFGAGGGTWSTTTPRAITGSRNISPPHRQSG